MLVPAKILLLGRGWSLPSAHSRVLPRSKKADLAFCWLFSPFILLAF